MVRAGPAPTAESAATLALSGLGFLAEDSQRLSRFLELTGIGPDELRAVADAPETLLAVLDHVAEQDRRLGGGDHRVVLVGSVEATRRDARHPEVR